MRQTVEGGIEERREGGKEGWMEGGVEALLDCNVRWSVSNQFTSNCNECD